ncbi:MAG TPA: hypothetical protein VF601_05375 [Beijerinckiaceae bacterium]
MLSDLAGKFGEVKVVSTKELHTDNHTPGSVRAKMHEACRAVDVRTAAPAAEVVAYLRTRREVAGVQSYRNGIIHLDAGEGVGAAAAPRPAPRLAKRRATGDGPAVTGSPRRGEAARAAGGTRRTIVERPRVPAAEDEPAATGSSRSIGRASDIRPPAQRRRAPAVEDGPAAAAALEPAPAPTPFAPAPPPGPER